jgi:hypothetical protein
MVDDLALESDDDDQDVDDSEQIVRRSLRSKKDRTNKKTQSANE